MNFKNSIKYELLNLKVEICIDNKYLKIFLNKKNAEIWNKNIIILINFCLETLEKFPVLIRNIKNDLKIINALPINYDEMKYLFEIENIMQEKSENFIKYNIYEDSLLIEIFDNTIDLTLNKENINIEIFEINNLDDIKIIANAYGKYRNQVLCEYYIF